MESDVLQPQEALESTDGVSNKGVPRPDVEIRFSNFTAARPTREREFLSIGLVWVLVSG